MKNCVAPYSIMYFSFFFCYLCRLFVDMYSIRVSIFFVYFSMALIFFKRHHILESERSVVVEAILRMCSVRREFSMRESMLLGYTRSYPKHEVDECCNVRNSLNV